MNQPSRSARQRGVSLIDALIAIAILSFGLIGMTRMQGRMVTSATDAQLRTTAVQLADELLNTVLVDTANAACYTLPQAGVCNSPAATARTTDWANRVGAALPGTVTRAVALNAASGRMTVSIGWTARDNADPRLLNVVTDVR
ncbi:MAG: pilus assembly protein PilV [Rubrivivax sp.]|jgi:type IV pilus assembly protein PilV|nr:pilus assembly protein PilV [Rubrivivax sp.]